MIGRNWKRVCKKEIERGWSIIPCLGRITRWQDVTESRFPTLVKEMAGNVENPSLPR